MLGARVVEITSVSALGAADVRMLGELPPGPQGPGYASSVSARLLRWKALHLGIAAFAQADLPDAEYQILGDGPDRKRLEALITELGVGDRVRLLGSQPRESVLQGLGAAHVLVHPSLHDSGGWVCAEAMAAGRPVLCLDIGGPGQQVTANVGLKVTPAGQEQTVKDLAQAMRRLASDRELRARLGAAGRLRVRERFTWETKIRHLLDRFGVELAKARAPSPMRQLSVDHDSRGG